MPLTLLDCFDNNHKRHELAGSHHWASCLAAASSPVLCERVTTYVYCSSKRSKELETQQETVTGVGYAEDMLYLDRDLLPCQSVG